MNNLLGKVQGDQVEIVGNFGRLEKLNLGQTVKIALVYPCRKVVQQNGLRRARQLAAHIKWTQFRQLCPEQRSDFGQLLS